MSTTTRSRPRPSRQQHAPAKGKRRPPARPTRPAPRKRKPAPVATAGDPKKRLVALLVVMCLAFGAVVARLVMIQGVSPDRYAALGESQRVRAEKRQAERGAVFDRNGRELAMSMPQKTVWANPHLVTDPAGEARLLAPVVNVDQALLQDRLSRDAGFVYLARKVDDRVARKVAALHLDGVALVDEPKRFNPAGPLAAPLLGSVGLDNEGLSGLELQYDKRLRGEPGELIVERDPTGQEIPAGQREFKAAQRGDDLELTIDRSLQYQTERALGDEIVKSSAKGGIAVVMDPKTGEILAMANLTADPAGGPPKPSMNNQAVTNVYEPGSVNKVITIAGALEEGLYSPSDVLSVPDALQVSDHLFHDHDPHPLKRWTVTDIMANSSNIGTIMIGQKLGKARIDNYLRDFGLGKKSGLDFPGESAGLLLDPKRWSGTSIGTVPIGQGLAVTALQMLSAYNTIANGGVWVAPQLVKATVDAQGKRQASPAPQQRRVVSAKTADQVSAMLAEVVRAGTGTAAAIDGYTVAGKTGTARKPREGARGYKAGAYVATFAGFVPAENPRLSAIVILDEPVPIYGGLVSAPVFANIAQYALRQFRIPPPARPGTVAVPAVDGAAADPTNEFDGNAKPAGTLPGSRAVPTSAPAPAPARSQPTATTSP